MSAWPKATFYPRIVLSGNVGIQSLPLADFGNWGSRAFGIGPQLSLPIFEGGRLRGMLHLREAQEQEAALNYQNTVLRASQEQYVDSSTAQTLALVGLYISLGGRF